MSEFEQPRLQDAGPTNTSNTAQPRKAISDEDVFAEFDEGNSQPADNTDKTDELSVAIAEQAKGSPVEVEPEKPRGPGKYRLRYYLHGKRIIETHETLPRAISRVADLRRMGISPETHTAK